MLTLLVGRVGDLQSWDPSPIFRIYPGGDNDEFDGHDSIATDYSGASG
jgi:hypothetical protein